MKVFPSVADDNRAIVMDDNQRCKSREHRGGVDDNRKKYTRKRYNKHTRLFRACMPLDSHKSPMGVMGDNTI